MVAQGDGKFGSEADPRIPPNQKKKGLIPLQLGTCNTEVQNKNVTEDIFVNRIDSKMLLVFVSTGF